MPSNLASTYFSPHPRREVSLPPRLNYEDLALTLKGRLLDRVHMSTPPVYYQFGIYRWRLYETSFCNVAKPVTVLIGFGSFFWEYSRPVSRLGQCSDVDTLSSSEWLFPIRFFFSFLVLFSLFGILANKNFCAARHWNPQFVSIWSCNSKHGNSSRNSERW